MSTRRPPLGRFHSVAEVAGILGVAENTVRRLIDSGALAAVNAAVQRGDVRWRISDRALEEYAEANSHAALTQRSA